MSIMNRLYHHYYLNNYEKQTDLFVRHSHSAFQFIFEYISSCNKSISHTLFRIIFAY